MVVDHPFNRWLGGFHETQSSYVSTWKLQDELVSLHIRSRDLSAPPTAEAICRGDALERCFTGSVDGEAIRDSCSWCQIATSSQSYFDLKSVPFRRTDFRLVR